MFVQFALDRVAIAVRGEQLMGTLESVLMTPTAPATIQLGSVSFDLLYIPLRTAIFLGGIALAFGLHYDRDGILPALLILLCSSRSCGDSASRPRRSSSRSAAARASWGS